MKTKLCIFFALLAILSSVGGCLFGNVSKVTQAHNAQISNILEQ